MIRARVTLACLTAVVAAVAAPRPAAAACTITFTGGAGTSAWGTVGNWDLGRVPVTTDDVCIPAPHAVTHSTGTDTINALFTADGATFSLTGGSLTIAAASQLDGSASMSAGTLAGSGEVVINGTLTWSGGTMTGAGTTRANGGASITGTSVKDLSAGRVFGSAGTTVWAGTGQLRAGSGATIRNAGIWDVQASNTVTSLGGTGVPRFINEAGGTFRRSAGTGSLTFNIPFDNAGAVFLDTGTLALAAGGTASGSFTTATGTSFTISGSTYTLDATSSLDAAAVSVTGGTLDVSGNYEVSGLTSLGTATARFNPSATIVGFGTGMSLNNGTVILNTGEPVGLPALSMTQFGATVTGTDTVNVATPINWSGGQMEGTGTINANAGIVFSGTVVKDISAGRILNTYGTTVWQSAPAVRLGSGATVRNFGTWDVQVNSTLDNLGGSGPRFVNQAGATFRRTAATGTLQIEVPFDNNGAVSLESGSLSLLAGGTNTDSFSGAAGTTWGFGASYTHASTSSLAGAAVSITAGTLDVSGVYEVSGLTSLGTATARFNPSATIVGFGTGMSLTNGTVILSTGEPVDLPALSMNQFGATITGTDTVNVATPIVWNGGQMEGAGTINANAGIVFGGTVVKDISAGRILNTYGTTVWQSAPAVRLGSGATVRNFGAWDVQVNSTLFNLGGSGPRFVNQAGATFRRTTGTGALQIEVPFDNNGAVALESGTISLTAGGTNSSTFTGAAGTTWAFGGSYTFAAASSLVGAAVSVTGGTLDVSGTYDLSGPTSVSNATARFNPSATILGFGSGVALNNGALDLNSGEPVALAALSFAQFGAVLRGADPVTVAAPINYAGGQIIGPGTVNAGGGIVFSTTTVKDITGGRVVNTYGTSVWQDAGPIRPGSGATIHNFGTWDVRVDASLVNLGGAAPRFFNEAGAVFQKSAGAATTSVQIPFENAGAVRAFSGTVAMTAGYLQTGGSASVEGGTISSTTPLDLQGGSLAGSGTVAASVVTQAARLSPGLSPGTLAITGAYIQSSAASFDVEIGGLAPGTQHDRADISGAATLAGGLNVTLVDGFSPADLDTFTIMTFPSSSAGAFAVTSLPPLPGDLVWKVHRNPTSVVLEVLADIDGDGVRNSSDCAEEDAGAWSIPAEVEGDNFASPAATDSLTWSSLAPQAGPDIVYDVVRGVASELRLADRPGEFCLASESTAITLTDMTSPPLGGAFYYLVRGANVCGRGTWGTTSSGVERTTQACP